MAQVWAVASKTPVKTLNNMLTRSNDVPNSVSQCGLRFSRCGSRLAVPTEQKVLVLDRASGWQAGREVRVPGLQQGEILTVLDWSHDGDFLLAGTNKGNLVLFTTHNWDHAVTVASGRKQNLCSLACHPNTDQAIFADMGGHWGLVEEIHKATGTEKAGGEKVEAGDKDMDALFNDDDEDENSFSISKTQAEVGYVKDDEGHLAYGSGEPTDSRPESALSEAASVDVRREVVRAAPPRLQPAFQPGASPAGLSYRFLVYNGVGQVRAHESEEESSLDVEFHDSAVHHALHLASQGSTMAALSARLLVTATQEGRLAVNHFASSDPGREWELQLGEEVSGVAAGPGWAAAATAARHLRIFSAGGLQREVVMLAGPLLCCVGEQDRLLVITHAAPGLHFQLYRVGLGGLSSLASGPLPSAPDTELYWAGFSDLLAPCTADTAGWVRVLETTTGLWHPLVNTSSHTRGTSDFHYLVGVAQLEGVVRAVLCRGSRYPPTLPRPIPIALPLEPPLVNTETEKGGLERAALGSSLQVRFLAAAPQQSQETEDALSAVKQQEVECVMKLFALACRADQESRALEVAALLPSLETLQLAIQYAAKMRRAGLAEKLGGLARQLQDRQLETQETQQEPEEEEVDSQDMFAPSQENPLLESKRLPSKVDKSSKLVSQATPGSRNPFAKKVEGGGGAVGSPSAGIVFDSIKSSSSSSLPPPERTGFGQRKISGLQKRPAGLVRPKQSVVTVKEKENQDGNQHSREGGAGLLAGFQLYQAEQASTGQEEALSKWKALSREEKDKYKLARLPNIAGEKRKRSDGDERDEGKKVKTSSKLAGFAFSGK